MNIKFLFTLSFYLLLEGSLNCQNVYENFVDGQVWVNLKRESSNNYFQKLVSRYPQSEKIELSFLKEEMIEDYLIREVSQPFKAAKESVELQNTFLIKFDNASKVDGLIEYLLELNEVQFAEKVPLLKKCITPNDSLFSSQWHLNKIGAPAAWNIFSTGSNIVIAIVDDAIKTNHQDIYPNLWTNTGDNNTNGVDDDGNGYIDDKNGFDVADNDNDPTPPNSSYLHGTHVAGIASSTTNNSKGIASIGYSTKLMCVKATNSSSSITHGYEGVVYAAASGADIINMSWGGFGNSQTGKNIIDWAYYTKGCLLVAAAGNNNTNNPFYPAAYSNVIGVSSTGSDDKKSNFSNYGSWVNISAPGNNILSTTVDGKYGTKSGTSMASPLVAGLCGLIKSLNPGLTNSDIRNCVLNNAVNINSVNSSFVGMLGTGRIDAYASMLCSQNSLTWLPVANFVANNTNINAGGSVLYYDSSLYNVNNWQWSFPGGNPSSFNGKNPPPIIYNTPGVYTASLSVSNANGSNNKIRTNYINVAQGGGCVLANWPLPSSWNITTYGSGSNGFVNGVNSTNDKEIAMLFNTTYSANDTLEGVHVAFNLVNSGNLNKTVTLKVYDGTSGSPGALLGTKTETLAYLRSNALLSRLSPIFFDPPIGLPSSKKFFVSVDISSLSWSNTPKDTLCILSNTSGETTPSAVWEKKSDNTWKQYNTVGSNWNLNISLLMHPIITDKPSVALLSANTYTICEGENVLFDASGSSVEDTLLWSFPGGFPSISSNLTQNVLFSNSGTFSALLTVVGGGCSLIDTATQTIEVKPKPTLSINSSSQTLCPGSTATITASGNGQNFSWSPSQGLSSTTGNLVLASPSTSTQYDIQSNGANGCVSNSSILIKVEQVPVVNVQPISSNICVGDSVIFDASTSSNINNYNWSFNGGLPASGSSSYEKVVFNNAGIFNIKLIASNSCFLDSSFNQTITVSCLSVEKVEDKPLITIQKFENGVLYLHSNNEEIHSIYVVDMLGRIRKLINNNQKNTIEIPFQDLIPGVYIISCTDNKGRQASMKLTY